MPYMRPRIGFLTIGTDRFHGSGPGTDMFGAAEAIIAETAGSQNFTGDVEAFTLPFGWEDAKDGFAPDAAATIRKGRHVGTIDLDTLRHMLASAKIAADPTS